MKSRRLALTEPEAVEVFRALASEARVRILSALSSSPMNVSALSEMLGISQSATTKHVQQLEGAGLITFEHRPGAQGTQKVCSLRDEALSVFLGPLPEPSVELTSLSGDASEVVEAAGVTYLSPELEGEIRAEETSVPVQVLFVNNTSTPYERYWLNFEGKREDYGTIMPSTVVTQMSWAGHPWLVAPPDGRPIGIFVTGTHVGCIMIGPAQATSPSWIRDMTRTGDSGAEGIAVAEASR